MKGQTPRGRGDRVGAASAACPRESLSLPFPGPLSPGGYNEGPAHTGLSTSAPPPPQGTLPRYKDESAVASAQDPKPLGSGERGVGTHLPCNHVHMWDCTDGDTRATFTGLCTPITFPSTNHCESGPRNACVLLMQKVCRGHVDTTRGGVGMRVVLSPGRTLQVNQHLLKYISKSDLLPLHLSLPL